MNKLISVLISLWFAGGLCVASVITQRTGCAVSSIAWSVPNSGPSCNLGEYATASTTVEFPLAGLYQTPVTFSAGQSTRANYAGNYLVSTAGTSIDALTYIFTTGPVRELELEGTISVSGGGFVRMPPPVDIAITIPGVLGTQTITAMADSGPGCYRNSSLTPSSCSFGFPVIATAGPISIEIIQSWFYIDATVPPPAMRMGGSEAIQVQLTLRLLETDFSTAAAFYVDQTPEPGTLAPALISLGLLALAKLRKAQ
jgi:hypothetical protein